MSSRGGGKEAAAARDRLASAESVKALLWFLKSNGSRIAAKQNSLIALRELLLASSKRERVAESMLEIEDLHQILFGFLRSPISPAITKLSLTLIFQLLQISTSKSSDRFKSSLIDADLVSFLLETIISSSKERSVSEKALGILDKLCDDSKGRAAASGNSLTVPLLVKKILRISAAATEFSVSVIWKLGRCDQRALVEGLQVGAFQKLVLVLQLGCGEETKEKATATLKMMNPFRNEFECTESLDFKNLKRSF
ncbi:unnamed protein product [Linum tenue]|nr:unnamed protein product [Linum tenue]